MNDPRDSSAAETSLTSSSIPMRQLAEAAVRMGNGPLPGSLESLSIETIRQLIHELSVHQIELEMQNEELRRTQEQLAAANARYFDLYELAPLGYCSTNAAGLIVTANLAATTLLGVTRGKLVNRLFFQFLHRADQDNFYQFRNRLVNTGETQTDDFRMLRSDGSHFWVQLVASTTLSEVGAPEIHIAFSDISGRKQTETELYLSENRMRATLDAIPDLMFELDLDGRYHDFHSPRTELLVAPAPDLMGHLVSEMLPVVVAQVVMAALQEADEQCYSRGKKYSLKLAQGECWFELSIAKKAIVPGELPRFIVLSRDITERHTAKEQLRISDMALKSISQGVLISDPDCRILSANAAFSAITGYSEAEILGRTCHFVQGAGTDPGTIAAIKFAQLHVTEFSGDILNYRKDGRSFWNELSIAPIFDAKGQVSHFIGITRDITARKLAQEALAQHHSTLEQVVTTRTAELESALVVSKIACEALLRSQLMLDQATHLGQLGAWAMDFVGEENVDESTFVCSAEMYRLFDFRPEDIPVPRHALFMARVHQKDQQRIEDLVMKALAEQCAWEAEYQIVWADGSEHWVVDTGKLLLDERGNAKSVHGAVKDVTAQRQLEAQLREREAELQMALQGAGAGSFEWNIDTGSTRWSREVWALNGLLPNEMPVSYATWRNTVMPKDLARLEQLTQLAISQRVPVEVEWQVNLPPGMAPRWLMSRAQPLPESDGQVRHYRGIVIDITKRRQAELALEQYRDHLEERVTERTAELVTAEAEQRRLNRALRLVSDCNLAVVHAQDEPHLLQELCRLVVETGGYLMAWVGIAEQDAAKTVRHLASFGDTTNYLDNIQISWDSEQTIGRGPIGMAIRSGAPQITQNCWTSPKMGPWRTQAVVRGYQSGAALPLLVNGVPWGVLVLYSAEPESFGANETTLLENLANDMAFGLMSLRARAQLEVHHQQLEALVSQRTEEISTLNTALMAKAGDAIKDSLAKGAFLAIMSHELRTPLNAVIGFAGLLVDSPLGYRQRNYADKIQLSAQALRTLIDDILDFSKIEAGELQLEQAPFSLNAILRTAAAMVGVGLGNKPVEAVFDLDADVPDALIGDALRLQQILLNLTSNAVKFTSSGAIVVAVRCKTGVDAAEGAPVSLQFAVRDTGIGIAPEKLGSIFSGFSQADATISRMYGGSGLGLAISQRLATMMGGQIEVESVIGFGSEFHFEVPLIQGQHADKKLAVGIPSSLHILVVDDDALVRKMLVQTCVALGWQATAVDSAAGALHELQRSSATDQDYDLLLLDWRMPDMNGLEMLRLAYATPGLGLPQVLLMAPMAELEQAMLASDGLHLDGIVAKPLVPGVLQEAIIRLYSGACASSLPMVTKNDMRLAGLRLLVAEDNPLNQEVIEQILIRAGAKVVLVGDGGEMVATLRSGPEHFDAVLIDIQMPLMDGYTAARIIREELGLVDLPLIAVTAFAQPQDVEKSRLVGMVGHVVKPLNVDDLVDLLVKRCRSLVDLPTQRQDHAQQDETSASQWLVLDIAAGLKSFAGDVTRFGGFLRKFVQQHGGDVGAARHLVSVHDPEAAIRLLHDLIGVASLLHAQGLAQLARGAEEALRSGHAEAMPVLFDKLQVAMDSVKASCHQFEVINAET